MDRDVDVIRVDDTTVKGLRDQLLVLVGAGDADGGFPILRQDEGGSRMVGFIGASELEHALSTCILFRCRLCGVLRALAGIVADEADSAVHFQRERRFGFGEVSSSSISSLTTAEVGRAVVDPFDFSVYMDQVREAALACSLLLARWSVVADADDARARAGAVDGAGEFAAGGRAPVLREAGGAVRRRLGRGRLL